MGSLGGPWGSLGNPGRTLGGPWHPWGSPRGTALYYGQVDFTMAKWTLLWPRMGQVDFTMAEPPLDSQTQLKNRPRRTGIFCGALKGPIPTKNGFSWFWPRWTLLWPRGRCVGGWLRAAVPKNAHPCFAEITHWQRLGRFKMATWNPLNLPLFRRNAFHALQPFCAAHPRCFRECLPCHYAKPRNCEEHTPTCVRRV